MQVSDLLTEIKEALESNGKRTLIGIVGKPGAGKSTVVEAIKERFDQALVSIIPMDGYHLSDEELIAQGKRDRKGAPDTFDSNAFVELLRRVKSEDGEITFPIFHRELEASIPDEGTVPQTAKVIITEGNYLLSQEHGFENVRKLLDKVYYIDINDEKRLERLIARHIRYGKTPDAAQDWAMGSDEANARYIETTKHLASDFLSLE
jgi:pantothenate kinase